MSMAYLENRKEMELTGVVGEGGRGKGNDMLSVKPELSLYVCCLS